MTDYFMHSYIDRKIWLEPCRVSSEVITRASRDAVLDGLSRMDQQLVLRDRLIDEIHRRYECSTTSRTL